MVAPLQIVQPGETRTRKTRRPQFPLAGTMRPYGLYPMWATPVLPGETLKSAEMKYRLLSMPIKHPLAGAWFETWMVYVSLTDMDEALAEMFISSDMATTGYVAAADNPRYFVKAGQIDYIKMAMDTITAAYFRDEEEPGTYTIDGVPMASRMNWDWAQNLQFQPAGLQHQKLSGMATETATGSLQDTYSAFDIMRLTGMSELTYERYLQQYGVSKKEAAVQARIPEILRYTRSWTVPTNTVEPTTGRPSSCWAFGETIKAEKPRRFDEPGFVICIGCVRPKLFDPTLVASMVGELWGFADWFPVYNLADETAGLKSFLLSEQKVLTGTGTPTTSRLLYDHRDLLSHGEGFVNNWSGPYDLPSITSRSVADATVYPDLRAKYPTTSDIDALFVEADADEPDATRMQCFYEGIASVEISGHVVDTTR